MNEILNERYKLIEIIGEGGMNTVYKAEDIETNTLVAIKILKREFADDEELVRKFHQESEAIRKLENENIVKVLDVGEDGEKHYIVMELLKTETLKEFILNKKGYFTNEEIIDLSLQILRAIKAAHEKNIVHRDIKPQNILLDCENNIKVSDFGIARVASNNTLKNTKEAIGSVHYASPEQARGIIVDERSDIYSFGILLYELSTGRLPFEGETAISIALKHTKGEIVNPSYLNSSLNMSIEGIIKKCVQIAASTRFQTVDEIIELFEILKTQPNESLAPEYKEALEVTSKTIDLRELRPAIEENLTEIGPEFDENPSLNLEYSKSAIKPIPIIAAFLSAIALGMIVLFFMFSGSFKKINAEKPFKLANIVGMNHTEATDLLSKKKLNIVVKKEEYSSDYEKNHIISQSPKAGITVKERSTINVVISKGSKLIEVPNFKGMSFDEARVVANNNTLKVKTKKEFSDEKTGTVIAQSIKKGNKVQGETGISLTISLGPKPKLTIMPNLIERSQSEAIQTLLDLNLIVGIVEPKHSDTIGEGRITWQSISQGSEIAEGSKVNMIVSLGKDKKEDEAIDDTELQKDDTKETNTEVIDLVENENNTENDGDKKPENQTETNTDEQGEKTEQVENKENTENQEKMPELKETTIHIPIKQEKESYEIKVVKVTSDGEEIIYQKVHKREEISVQIAVRGTGVINLKVYQDDEFYSDTSLEF